MFLRSFLLYNPKKWERFIGEEMLVNFDLAKRAAMTDKRITITRGHPGSFLRYSWMEELLDQNGFKPLISADYLWRVFLDGRELSIQEVLEIINTIDCISCSNCLWFEPQVDHVKVGCLLSPKGTLHVTFDAYECVEWKVKIPKRRWLMVKK